MRQKRRDASWCGRCGRTVDWFWHLLGGADSENPGSERRSARGYLPAAVLASAVILEGAAADFAPWVVRAFRPLAPSSSAAPTPKTNVGPKVLESIRLDRPSVAQSRRLIPLLRSYRKRASRLAPPFLALLREALSLRETLRARCRCEGSRRFRKRQLRTHPFSPSAFQVPCTMAQSEDAKRERLLCKINLRASVVSSVWMWGGRKSYDVMSRIVTYGHGLGL